MIRVGVYIKALNLGIYIAIMLIPCRCLFPGQAEPQLKIIVLFSIIFQDITVDEFRSIPDTKQ